MVGPTTTPIGQQANTPLPTPVDRLLRPARALIGWLPDDRALLVLNSSRADLTATEEQRAQVQAAHLAVQQRPEAVAQTDLVRDVPETLAEHIERLEATAAGAYFREGWHVALVDLPRVYAFQPTVFTDSSTERAQGVDALDPVQLATVTLPTVWELEQNVQLDEASKQWLLVSRNPNLRVVGHFAGQIQQPGPPLFGFFVTINPSFLQVARYQERYFLRDGYHRSIGLIALGARYVPAFVRDMDSIQDLLPPGMLPQEAFLGPRPPTLADYYDDAVSVSVELPASQKMVVVQALELSPLG